MIKYPHFISDKPLGKDCFDGRSQERLAHGICDYVRMADAVCDDEEKAAKDAKAALPRIIGLEGEWGSGKSNVVSMIGGELTKEGYYTFTYDAWGHQEDLQRRSILETLTGKLIADEVLQGKVRIPMRNGRLNEDTWNNQLSLLLSNKTTTIRHSVPNLSGAAVWGICLVAAFAVLTVITGVLLDKVSCFPVWLAILLDVTPLILGLFVSTCFRCKDGNWNSTLRIISQKEDDTIDEEYTSSEEPSVSEFKNWMKAISDYLGSDNKRKYKKLIIVFDNMDRLPSEKVMQLWSSMYTFFAGGDFENIWAIIPYDYKHLCQAIYGSEENEEVKGMDTDRIKQFISKTFPITYHVPQPVITDYRKLFSTYFDEAFGPNIHDKEHICQVFMHLIKSPNPRTVISFVNELVALRMQWADVSKYRLQNLALFVLKKGFLFYNEGVNDKAATLESNLLSEDLFKDIAYYYPDQDGFIRRQMCQFAYGIDDENLAGELPLYLELQRLLSEGGSIKDYASQPNFVTVLEKVLSNTKESEFDNIVKSMSSLDGFDFGDEQSSIQSKWDMLANQKVSSAYTKHEYDQTLDTLVRHSTEIRVKDLCRSFCRAMHDIKIEKGDIYFDSLYKLKCALESIGSTINLFDFVLPKSTTPEHFVEFLKKAGRVYKEYKLSVDNQELNDYLLNNAISGNESSAIVTWQLKDDNTYSFDYLKEYLAQRIKADEIKDDIRPAAYINRILDSGNGIIQSRFTAATVSAFVEGAKTPWSNKSSLGSEDVLAIYLADGNDLSDVNDDLLPRLSECIERYIDSSELLTHLGSKGTTYNKLNAYMIKNRIGQGLDIPYFAKNILIIRDSLGLEVKTLLDYSNDWEYDEIEDLTVSNIHEYVYQDLFADYLASLGSFTEGLIKQGTSILEAQTTGFLTKISPSSSNPGVSRLTVNSYWRQFVLAFVGTKFIPKLDDLLTKELITMLRHVVLSNSVQDQELMSFMLSHEPVGGVLREYLNDVMNNHFTKTDVSATKFKVFGGMLPVLTSDMDTNTARNIALHFIKPIYTDKECARIIVANRDYYLSVLKKDVSAVQDILKGMIDNAETSDIYGAIKEEVDGMILREEKSDSSE